MAQIHGVMESCAPRVIKIGSLGNTKVRQALGAFLDQAGHDKYKIVIDPAMGDLDHVEKDALDVMKRSMIVYADVLVLEIKEAAMLTGTKIETVDDMHKAAAMLLSLGPSLVVLRGDELSLPSQDIFDVVADINSIDTARHKRQPSTASCNARAEINLAAAMACCLARGLSHRQSYDKARAYVSRAIETAPALDFENESLRHFVGDVG
jgi:hydroxymethylpyrimidine/phosphomethylpyrimidine kinase